MFEVNTWDTSVYTAVGCFLVLIAALAALIPAWRATLINPVKALKNE
jgi:ABC-type lipoprotein release transport system permease subunit